MTPQVNSENTDPTQAATPGQNSLSRRRLLRHAATGIVGLATGAGLEYVFTRRSQTAATPQAHNTVQQPDPQATMEAQRQQKRELRNSAIATLTSEMNTLTERIIATGEVHDLGENVGRATLVVNAPKGGPVGPDKYAVISIFHTEKGQFVPGTVQYFEAALVAQAEGNRTGTQEYMQFTRVTQMPGDDFEVEDQGAHIMFNTADGPSADEVAQATSDLQAGVDAAIRQVPVNPTV